MSLPTAEVWSRASAGAPAPEPVPGEGPNPVAAAVHCATRDGVEDLGGLVRQWLAPGPDGQEQYGGFAFCDPPRPLSEIGVRHGSGRRWYHPFGLRLALRRA